jgi:hypothetical protein
MGSRSAFSVGPRKTTETHDRIGRSQCLSGCKLASSHQSGIADWTTAKLLLALASTVILGSESHGTHDHVLLCHESGSLQTTVPVRQLQIMQIIYKNSVRTSQETHYVSATKPNRLMLFGETVAVYCENRTEYINTLCGQNIEF